MTAAHTNGVIPELTDARRLMLARLHADMSQSEFARVLGVTPATVQRAEAGLTRPRRTTFMAWSLATGVDLQWLETGKTPTPGDDGPDQGVSLTGGKHITPVRELRIAA